MVPRSHEFVSRSLDALYDNW